MGSKHPSGASCTVERLEELFSNARAERSLAAARRPGPVLEMPAASSRRPLSFPTPPARDPFLSRVKNDPFPSPSQPAQQEDPLRHFRVESRGEEVETSVVSFLVVLISCTWLLFWLIGQFAHIVLPPAH